MSRLTLNEIKPKLPPEGQVWLDSMDRDEQAGAATILNNLGEAGFLLHWEFHKAELDKIRFDFWRPGNKNRGSPI